MMRKSRRKGSKGLRSRLAWIVLGWGLGVAGAVEGVRAGTGIESGEFELAQPFDFVPENSVVINEFLAVNRSGKVDQDGDREDWLELKNISSNPISLVGWSLSDDPGEPRKFILGNRILQPNEFWVLVASGKGISGQTSSDEVHLNFRLDQGGEFLGLFNANTPPQWVSGFADGFPPQAPDVSYGLGGSGLYQYLKQATPGTDNSEALEVLGVLPQPTCSHASGFYSETIWVNLTTPEGLGAIRYTLDGSEPGSLHGELFKGPVQIDPKDLGGRSGVVLRAVAEAEGYLSSAPLTRTFLFPDAVFQQSARPSGFPLQWGVESVTPGDYEMDPDVTQSSAYQSELEKALFDLPSLSLSLNMEDWFGASDGLFSFPSREGLVGEHPVHAEWIPSRTGENGFSVDCGIRVQGGSSTQNWKSTKLSLRLLFKGEYGPSQLEYPLFAETAVSRFNTLVLDAHLNLAWTHTSHSQRVRAQYVRDLFMNDLQRAMGHPSPHGRFAHLFINGLYWGIYDIHEQPDAAFSASYLGGDRDDYDVLKHNGGQVDSGTLQDWNRLMTLIRNPDRTLQRYHEIESLLDLENFIDYMLLNFYGGNTDWPHHNWYASRKRGGSDGFRFFSWDAEHVLKSIQENVLRVDASNGPGEIFAALKEYSEFRLDVADRMQKHFFDQGVLDATAFMNPLSLYSRRIQEIESAVILESARWGDARPNDGRPGRPYERNIEWKQEWDWLRTQYFPQRSAVVLDQLKSAGFWPSLARTPARVKIEGGEDGLPRKLVLEGWSGTAYYSLDGADPRLAGGENVDPSAGIYQDPVELPTHAGIVKVRVRHPSGVWSPLLERRYPGNRWLPRIVISEIHYHPQVKGGEFVEVTSLEHSDVSLDGWSFSGIDFVFPQGTLLKPQQPVVIAEDSQVFSLLYPDIEPLGYYRGSLNNGGETIWLLDGVGNRIDGVSFGETALWPAAANGSGHSLEWIWESRMNRRTPAAWRPSERVGGTPGQIDPAQARPTVQIQEVMAKNRASVAIQGIFADWLEVRNVGLEEIDMSAWRISDESWETGFRFPPGSQLSAGERRVLLCDSSLDGLDGWVAPFELNGEGETLVLWNADGRVVDQVSFGHQLESFSLARSEETQGWFLAEPTPGAPDRAALTGEIQSLILNEWMIDPFSGGSDWIEFWNSKDPFPIPLKGLYLEVDGQAVALDSDSYLAPGGFLVIEADSGGSPEDWGINLPKGLNHISLRGSDGTLLDEVTTVSASEGHSQGRVPDGGFERREFSFPTPNESNLLDYEQDSDGDGLSDLWEVKYELDPMDALDGRIDSDGDGMSNYQEHESGTNPRNASSVFRIEWERQLGQDGLKIQFQQEPGFYYALYQITDWKTQGDSQTLIRIFSPRGKRTEREEVVERQGATTGYFLMKVFRNEIFE